MKKIFKITLIIIGILMLLVVLLLIGCLILVKIGDNKAMVEEKYYELITTHSILESKYKEMGIYKVLSKEFNVENEVYKKYKIWYPSELEASDNTYPLVIMANGTGVPYNKYEPVFEHLTSWGFIVISNDDPSSALGFSTSKTLDFILNLNKEDTSIFYKKVDIENIGIAGHSQGGVAVINSITKFNNSDMYKVAYTASMPTKTMISSWKLEDFNYDIDKVMIPILMVGATGKVDAETISPLEDMMDNYDHLSDTISKVMARRCNSDHGDMLKDADAYMTAWFMYYLKNDSEAKKIFVSENAEILNNENWQDVHKNK